MPPEFEGHKTPPALVLRSKWTPGFDRFYPGVAVETRHPARPSGPDRALFD